jgi:hypothetical protein
VITGEIASIERILGELSTPFSKTRHARNLAMRYTHPALGNAPDYGQPERQ